MTDDRQRLEELRARARLEELRARRDVQSAERVPRSAAAGLGATDTFFGGFADEITGLSYGAVRGYSNFARRLGGLDVEGRPTAAQEYRRGTDLARRAQRTAQEDRPATYLGGQVGGGIAAVATGGAAAPQSIRAAATSRPLAAGVGVGAVEGGVYGLGSGEGSAADRLPGAGVGAGAGAALGLALPGAAQLGQNAFRGGRQLVREGVDAARTARAQVPSIDDLYGATRQAYQAVDEAGVRYSSRTTQRLLSDIRNGAEQLRLNDRLHPRAQTIINDVLAEDLAQPRTLTELDQLRQYVRRELASSSEGGEREAGRMIIQRIDEMIESAVPEGRVENAGTLIRTARRASRTQRAAEALEDAIDSAIDRAGSTGTGGNEQNAIRQNLRRLLTNERTARLFTDEQKDLIRRAVRGDNIQNTLRILSGLSPDRGLINLLGSVGGGAMIGGGPGAVILPAVGMGARQLAEGRQQALLSSIRRSVRSGADSAQ